jgi:hypothetical protein
MVTFVDCDQIGVNMRRTAMPHAILPIQIITAA